MTVTASLIQWEIRQNRQKGYPSVSVYRSPNDHHSDPHYSYEVITETSFTDQRTEAASGAALPRQAIKAF